MRPSILRHLPFVIALAAALWCLWIGVRIWQTPRVWVGVTAQTAEEAAQGPPATVREVRPFSESSPLGMLPLAIPFILALMAALIARFQAPGYLAVLVGLFLGYVFVTGFSIGGAYTGPAIALGAAALLEAGLSFRDMRRASAET